MFALILSLHYLGGRANTAALQVMLAHENDANTRRLIKQAVGEGWLTRTYALRDGRRVAIITLTKDAHAEIAGRLESAKGALPPSEEGQE